MNASIIDAYRLRRSALQAKYNSTLLRVSTPHFKNLSIFSHEALDESAQSASFANVYIYSLCG